MCNLHKEAAQTLQRLHAMLFLQVADRFHEFVALQRTCLIETPSWLEWAFGSFKYIWRLQDLNWTGQFSWLEFAILKPTLAIQWAGHFLSWAFPIHPLRGPRVPTVVSAGERWLHTAEGLKHGWLVVYLSFVRYSGWIWKIFTLVTCQLCFYVVGDFSLRVVLAFWETIMSLILTDFVNKLNDVWVCLNWWITVMPWLILIHFVECLNQPFVESYKFISNQFALQV